MARQRIAARDIDQRQRRDFQAPLRASGTAIEKGAEAGRVFPAFGHKGSILHFDPFVRAAQDSLQRQVMEGRPVERGAKLPLDGAFTVVTRATQVAQRDVPT